MKSIWKPIEQFDAARTEFGGYRSKTIIGRKGSEIHSTYFESGYPLRDGGQFVYAEASSALIEGDYDSVLRFSTWEPTHFTTIEELESL